MLAVGMLHYTSLFTDLEQLFRTAGKSPASFRRLQREVERAGENLREYYLEVATDFAARLERRLLQPGAQLAPEEAALLRAFLGVPPADAEREQQLLDDLAELEEALETMLRLRGAPLHLRNLDALQRLLGRMGRLLDRIVPALEERERSRRFEAALADGGVRMDRHWLQEELRRVLSGSESTGEEEGALLASDDALDPGSDAGADPDAGPLS